MSFSTSPPPSYKSQHDPAQSSNLDNANKNAAGSVVETAPQDLSPRPRIRDLKVKVSVESLQRIAGNEVRRSKYGPEFLKLVADHGLSGETDAEGKFKVVTGSEAVSIYEGFVGEHQAESSSSRQLERKSSTALVPQQPVVFAFTASDGARKVVDYYMTWRGKTVRIFANFTRGQGG
ncbi:hypothetical protein HGRIS_008637 [Hohenbuehelia grisea]|uniref:Uncharacterized protein n=1 Tax=Hohenbuehelia grisea TaxID=104357 RepID=A0ABR3J8L3_9AGAR